MGARATSTKDLTNMKNWNIRGKKIVPETLHIVKHL
jgi:hypothetical protein